MTMAITRLFTALGKVNLNGGVKKGCFCLKGPEVFLPKPLWCAEGGRQEHFSVSKGVINSLFSTSASYPKVKAVTLLPLSNLP